MKRSSGVRPFQLKKLYTAASTTGRITKPTKTRSAGPASKPISSHLRLSRCRLSRFGAGRGVGAGPAVTAGPALVMVLIPSLGCSSRSRSQRGGCVLERLDDVFRRALPGHEVHDGLVERGTEGR